MNRLTAPRADTKIACEQHSLQREANKADPTQQQRFEQALQLESASQKVRDQKRVPGKQEQERRSKLDAPSQTAKRLTRRRNWQRGSWHVQPHTPKPLMESRREAIGRNPYCFLRRRRRYPRAYWYQLFSKSMKPHKLSSLGECRVISPAVLSYLAQPNRRPGTESMKIQKTCH